MFATFAITSVSLILQGEISVAKELDRETRSFYTLYVTAIDNPDNPKNQRTNQTKAITIEVEDVNDNDPEFTNIDSNTRAPVLENAWDPDKEGQVVFSVSAEDKDIGENARLVYTISANETVKALFKIETVSRSIGGVPKYFGDIRVADNLLGNVGDLYLNVMVTDQGVPPRSAQTRLTIVVEDVNLHQPVFTKPEGPRASVTTPEVLFTCLKNNQMDKRMNNGTVYNSCDHKKLTLANVLKLLYCEHR